MKSKLPPHFPGEVKTFERGLQPRITRHGPKKAAPSRRQQRKDEIKGAIIDAAHELFEERGFNQVTVAEVAEKAGTTVKTLFTYFDSKEDLVFEREMDFIREIIEKLKNRKRGIPVVNEFRSCVLDLLKKTKGQSSLESLEGFERLTDNPVLKSRLQMMWLKYEDSLCEYFQVETNATAEDALPRLAAIQLIALLRILTGPEAKACAAADPKRSKMRVEKWFSQLAKSISLNLKSFAIQD